MRKFILMALAGSAIVLAAPEISAATPLSLVGGGLNAAADNVASTETVRHRRWHRYHRSYRRCWHRRYTSGRRCVW